MGEATRKSRSRREVLDREARCIYCPGPAETWEHMPPVGMFRDRQRPGGMEYGACKSCNEGTRGSDAVASWFARLHPDNDAASWQEKEIRKLKSAVNAKAPGVLEELSRPEKFDYGWGTGFGSNVLRKFARVHADGPRVKAHLSIFGAKLGMALYREHIGVALPLDGAVWSECALSGGMTAQELTARVEKLPIQTTLSRGRKNVGDQFAYRYNRDERTFVAAVVQFNRSLWFTIFASSNERIVNFFLEQETSPLPASVVVRPGGLLRLLAS